MKECKHDFEYEILNTKNAFVKLARIQTVSLEGKTSDHGYGVLSDHKDKTRALRFNYCPWCGADLRPESEKYGR